MTDTNSTNLEESGPEAYTRFTRLLTAIAAVPKSAIQELDPRIKTKPKSASESG